MTWREPLTGKIPDALLVCEMSSTPFQSAAVVTGLLLIASFSGCSKTTAEAIVLEKEHIDAAENTPSPSPEPASSASNSLVTPGASPMESPNEEYGERELAPDEIVVDTFVMKKDVRGTSKDPRASTDEQWRIRVELIQDSKKFTVQTNRKRWEKLKVGDRIKVRYRQGNYTGTVWTSEIVD